MRLKKRRGSALLLTMIVMMVTFMLGIAFTTLGTQSMLRGRNDFLRAEATNLAEAGVEKALYYLRATAPDGTTDGSWRTTGLSETISGEGSYTIYVSNGAGANAGKLVVEAQGVATISGRTAKRKVRAVAERSSEDVSIWNNVVFGGVGQAGKSIAGNVVMCGSMHLLGDGEPFTDSNGNGHWDANDGTWTDSNHNGIPDPGEYTDANHNGHYDPPEPYVDVNGNGTYDPPLTTTDLAEDISGTAYIGNNYSGMPSSLSSKVPTLPTKSFGGETVQSINAKLRVKAGMVNISGSATAGAANVTGGSPPVKETLDGVYVNDGFGGNKGAASVYSDNGTSTKYDLANWVKFPTLVDPVIVGGHSYSSQDAYLSAVGLHVNGDLSLTSGTAGLTVTDSSGHSTTNSALTDGLGNSITVDASGNITINGIVYVQGNAAFNRGSHGSQFVYTGRGTVYATGNLDFHSNILSNGTFPTTDAMGFIAGKSMGVATGSGDSQLTMMGAFYAQDQITSAKQNNIAGTFVSSYFSMTNVPHMWQVPALVNNLPPGMPGAGSISVVKTTIDSWRSEAPG